MDVFWLYIFMRSVICGVRLIMRFIKSHVTFHIFTTINYMQTKLMTIFNKKLILTRAVGTRSRLVFQNKIYQKKKNCLILFSILRFFDFFIYFRAKFVTIIDKFYFIWLKESKLIMLKKLIQSIWLWKKCSCSLIYS